MAMTAEERRAKARASYYAHREHRIAKATAYAMANAEKVRAYKQQWNAENRERIAAQKRDKYEANREAIRAKRKAEYAANPDTAKERARAYRKANPDKAKAAVREWCKANAEYLRTHKREYFRADYAARPEKYREKRSRRRAIERASWVETIDYAAILRESGGVCGICRMPLDLFGIHFDHIVPLAKGGAHVASNIQVAHARCNLKKGAAWP